MQYLFVYGQLKRGMALHGALKAEEFLGEDSVKGKLHTVGPKGYTFFMLKKGDDNVPGELYRVSDRTLATIDFTEHHPLTYERRQVYTDKGFRAWAYFYNGQVD
jgi:gamma-glutamylcyclotransferase (GGCT)/AIG2-like uncharacterized protein YtfP